MEVIAGERERDILHFQFSTEILQCVFSVESGQKVWYVLSFVRWKDKTCAWNFFFFKRLERKSAVSDVILSCLQNEGEMSTFNKSSI